MRKILVVAVLLAAVLGCRGTGHPLATAPGVNKGEADPTPIVIIIDDEVAAPGNPNAPKHPRRDVSTTPDVAPLMTRYTTGHDDHGEYRDWGGPVTVREYEFQQ